MYKESLHCCERLYSRFMNISKYAYLASMQSICTCMFTQRWSYVATRTNTRAFGRMGRRRSVGRVQFIGVSK